MFVKLPCSPNQKYQHVDLARVKAAVIKDGLAKQCSQCKISYQHLEKTTNSRFTLVELVEDEKLWLCLACGNQVCTRCSKMHARRLSPNGCTVIRFMHPIFMGTETWKVRCVECETNLDISHCELARDMISFLQLTNTRNRIDKIKMVATGGSQVSKNVSDNGIDKIKMVATGCQVSKNVSKNDNVTLIHAAAAGDLAAVKKSLKSGANINSIQYYKLGGNTYKVTSMGASAYNGHIEVVQYLVEAGANPYIVYDGWTPRVWAMVNGNHADIAKYLEGIMKLPKWRNKIDEESRFTPLTCAIFNNNHAIIENCINFGADVCRVDGHGKTPLIYAIEKNLPEVVEKLLEKGAIASGVSALNCAIELRRNDIAKLLINDKGLKIDGFFEDGYTPLTKSLSLFNTEITNCLIHKGADPSKVDANKNIPIDQALEINCLEIIEALVSNGAKIPSTIGKRGFYRLAEDGDIETYKFLIRKGWNVNQVDKNGKTALALSTANGFLSLSMLLVKKGADIDLANKEVEAFRKKNIDFDGFLQGIVTKKNKKQQHDQEMCCVC